jgi:hypothetical protein
MLSHPFITQKYAAIVSQTVYRLTNWAETWKLRHSHELFRGIGPTLPIATATDL